MSALDDMALAAPSLSVAADVDALVAAAVGLRLIGWSCKESDGSPAAASFNIKNSATGAAGSLLVPVELTANESAGDWYGPDGIDAQDGLSIDHVAGTFHVVLYHKTVS